MGVSGVNAATQNTTGYEGTTTVKPETTAPETDKKDTAASEGAVYDKTSSDSTQNNAIYKINKMSSEERAKLVEKLKSAQADRESQLVSIVNKLISKQANTYSQANESFWRLLSKGNLTVTPEIKAQAEKDISEDGDFGVKKTAQNIFDFASALAGDDVDKMKEMQKAFEKGFKQAEKLWGGEGKLPKISYDTQDSVNKMFEDYYKSKETITEETV